MPIFTRGFSGKDRQSNWTPDALAEDTYFEEPTLAKDQRAMTGGKFEKLDLPLQTSYAQAAQAAAYASEENLALLQRLLPRIKINAQEPHRGETLLIVALDKRDAARAAKDAGGAHAAYDAELLKTGVLRQEISEKLKSEHRLA